MGELGIKEFVAGTVAGFAQVYTGQPFDILKVRQATSPIPIGTFTAARNVYKQEGIFAFWRGTLAPILGVGLFVSIQFGVLSNSKKILSKYKGKDLSAADFLLCGSLAGMGNSIVSAPVEHFRIKMQVQGKVDPRGDPIYKSSGDCITQIFKNHGLAGVYKGFLITFIRDAIGYGTYFGAYEFVIQNFLIPEGGTRKSVPLWQFFITGGFSGFFFWGPWYPIDAVKSKIHGDSLANPRFKGIRDCFRTTWASEGVAGFYKGFWPCMMRAFPVNSAKFFAFELTMRAIS